MSFLGTFASKQSLKRWLSLVVPVPLLFTLFVATGIRGVDLGHHWDEVPWHIDPVRQMVDSGLFLPRSYIYPSLSKWLVLLPSLPGAFWTFLKSHGDPTPVQVAMQTTVNAPDYLLTARRLFIVISAFAIVWIYGAVLALRRSPWEATIAACCLGLSWEYAYHARWVANDCILTQFAALTLLLLALFRRFGTVHWLYLAAVSVGLGTGAKQPGVFVILPVIPASVLSLPLRRPIRQSIRLAIVCALAFGAFVATTPGVLLDPFVFFGDLRRISTVYGAGHAQYTASGPWQHMGWVLTYLTVEFFSPFHAVSVLLSACALPGALFWWRQDRRFMLILLLYPVLFVLFFCTKYVVMIARNYLPITPFLAVLVARGVIEIYVRLRNVWVRRALLGAGASVALLQAAWLIRAGESIRHYDLSNYTRQAIAYVRAHPKERFRVSQPVKDLANKAGISLPANVVRAPRGEAVVMLAQTWVSGANTK